jgi:hypothetical protein
MRWLVAPPALSSTVVRSLPVARSSASHDIQTFGSCCRLEEGVSESGLIALRCSVEHLAVESDGSGTRKITSLQRFTQNIARDGSM